MKRRTLHLAFGAFTLGFAALAALQAWQWRAASNLNATLADGDTKATGAEARLAQAVRLAAAGSYDAALAAYQDVSRGPRPDLARIAQFDMANLHLRTALKDGAGNTFKVVTLVELAKQHYRALLRADPDDWDVRYNLERALALAPEVEQGAVIDNEPPTPRERAASTLPGTLSDLP